MAGELIALTREALARDAVAKRLDGSQGTNRCRSRTNQLGQDVDDDVAAVFAWIRHRAASEKSKRVFLGEARRLFFWSFGRARKPISSLTLEDLEAYREFLKQPPSDWIGRKVPYLTADGDRNPQWRPFEKPMTEAHVAHVFAVLKSLFKYLTDTGYLDGNPLIGMLAVTKTEMGDDRARKIRVTERALDQEQWDAVIAAVEELPQTSDNERTEYERARFIVRLFYHLGARLKELTRHRMEHFVLVHGRWKWSVVGKGGKHREIGVNEELLEAIKRYRAHLKLPPLPVAGESNPLLFNIYGKKKISDQQVYRIVKRVFALAAERLRATHPDKAAVLKHASPHWIRHATASHLAKDAKTIEELRAVQDHMRHTNLKTTLDYTHVEDEAAAAVAERLTTKVDVGKKPK